MAHSGLLSNLSMLSSLREVVEDLHLDRLLVKAMHLPLQPNMSSQRDRTSLMRHQAT